MTITMTTKNQVTLPKKIVDALGLSKGCLFDAKVSRNCIELVPLEVKEKSFTEEDFKKLDKLVREEKKKGTKKLTPERIDNLTKN